MSHQPYVLLVGYRRQLAQGLAALGIPYSIWTEKSLLNDPPGVDRVVKMKIPRSKQKILDCLPAFQFAQNSSGSQVTPTHIIAGTENAVFPSALIRRHYDARISSQTILMRCTDKLAMKQYLKRYGIPMTDFAISNEHQGGEDLVAALGLPLVIKQRVGSGSRGIVFALSQSEVNAHFGRRQIYEKYIEGREGSVESFVNEGEILFSNVTEYYEKKHINVVPATYDQAELKDILELNSLVLKALKIRWGMTHLEFYRTSGGVLFGEVALRPPGGYIMELMGLSYGFDPWQAYLKIELGMEVQFPTQPRLSSACLVLHPGPGKILKIRNLDPKTYPTLQKAKIKASEGDLITSRVGVGEDLGYLIFGNSRFAAIEQDLAKLRTQPIFTMGPSS